MNQKSNKKPRTQRMQKLLKTMFNGNQQNFDDFIEGIVADNVEIVEEFAEQYPNFSSDNEF